MATGSAARNRPRLTPRRLAILQAAADHPRGSILIASGRAIAASDKEAFEQLGYAASIDNCGHVQGQPDPDGSHASHPHFFRITPAGRAAAASDHQSHA